MKKLFLILLVVLVGIVLLAQVRERRLDKQSVEGIEAGAQGTYAQELVSDGLSREYLLHIPASYTPGTPVPLVIFLHGGGGGMYQAEEDYPWTAKADAEGFILVYGKGTSRLNGNLLNTWNAGECCAYARDNDVDDVQYIKDVIADVERHVSIDKERIFATGFSNGAMMSHRLACEMSDVFAAIGAVSGTDNTLACEPTNHINIMHIHAKDDNSAKYDGGAGATFEDKVDKVTEFRSVADTIDLWLDRNGITSAATRVLDKPGVACDRYTGTDGVVVELCTLDVGGHTWPGGTAEARRSGLVPSQALDATDTIWDFFMEVSRS